MKRTFEEPRMDVVDFGVEDVITASGNPVTYGENETEIGGGQ